MTLGAVSAADVDGPDVRDLCLDEKVAVPAKHVADTGILQQKLAYLYAPQIGFGEVPLGAVRRRKKLREWEVMDRRHDVANVRKLAELRVQLRQQLIQELIVRAMQFDELAIIPAGHDLTGVRWNVVGFAQQTRVLGEMLGRAGRHFGRIKAARNPETLLSE